MATIESLTSILRVSDFLGLANRGLGNLETAQDEKVDETVKMQALTDGNHYYAGSKHFISVFLFIHLHSSI